MDTEATQDIRHLFLSGRFPVATVDTLAGRGRSSEVLGLVASRGYNPEEAFYGMLGRAAAKGAQGIIGYRENVAFHPDGTKFFSCCGTAVRLVLEENAA